jgi:N-acetylglucosaminyl-diphospho-decaprenol L-rhamnosyltransferase
MLVAVAIVAYRNTADVLACLQALARSTYEQFEVVICENGGPEAYAALQACVPHALPGGQPVRVILAPGNLGYAGGVNLCLGQTPQADAWWVLNPDTEPRPDALALQVLRLESGDCDAVGCTVQLPGGIIQSYGGYWQRLWARAVSIGHGSSALAAPLAAEIERRQNYLNGAAMIVTRGFLDRVGPMREDYFLYCEEVEWCLRALQRGARLAFEPSAVVLHHQGTTTGNVTAIRQRPRLPVYLSERNRLLLTRDCFPALLMVAAVGALAVIMARYARRGAWRQVAYALAGWWAGLSNERGAPAWMAG